MSIKVSVGVTCWHKDVHMLPEAIKNISEQTIPPDEIIVVANNIEELTIEDPSIKSKFVRERKPVSWSRNQCASMSTGDVVMFFDVDDIPHPQKIEVTKHVFENTDADCFVHGFEENKDTTEEYADFSVERITELISPQGYLKIPNDGTNTDLHHGHLSVKRDIVLNNPYNENLGFYEFGFQYWGEDTELCKRLFQNGHKFYYGVQKLINYRPSFKSDRKWYNA